MIVAVQGEKGSFSEIIASKLFMNSKILSCKSFNELFSAIENGLAEYAVLPVENSTEGRIREATNLLMTSNLDVVDEGNLKIIHCLISKEKIDIQRIERIYGHPEAISQCRKFLSSLKCEIISWYDGAGAVELIKSTEFTALIASERVADIYKLQVIKKCIQDLSDNTTRFFVLSNKTTHSTGKDKTTIYFSTKHHSGALYEILGVLKEYKINMTRLESIPSGNRPWEYFFLVDVEGHKEDSELKEAIQKMNHMTAFLKIIGSYPTGKIFK